MTRQKRKDPFYFQKTFPSTPTSPVARRETGVQGTGTTTPDCRQWRTTGTRPTPSTTATQWDPPTTPAVRTMTTTITATATTTTTSRPARLPTGGNVSSHSPTWWESKWPTVIMSYLQAVREEEEIRNQSSSYFIDKLCSIFLSSAMS